MISKIIIGFALFTAVTATVNVNDAEVIADGSNGTMILQGQGDDGHTYTVKIKKDCTDLDLGNQHICIHEAEVDDENGKVEDGYAVDDDDDETRNIAMNPKLVPVIMERRWKGSLKVSPQSHCCSVNTSMTLYIFKICGKRFCIKITIKRRN